MRHSCAAFVCVAAVSAAACSNSNPVAPTPFPSGGLDAKGDPPVNVNGVMTGFAGSPAAFQFVVGATPVQGDDGTEFFGGSLFAHLADGARVEVKGSSRGSFVYAKRIHVNSPAVNDDSGDTGDGSGDPPPPPPPCGWPASPGPAAAPTASRFGEILMSSITGTAPDLVLGGAGRPVYTSAATVVRRNTDLLPFWILRPGMIVEIFGPWDSTRIDAVDLNLSRNTLDVTAEGNASLVLGDYPEVRFVVGTTAFLANEWTKFSGEPCDVLVEGAQLRLRGVRMADGVTALATFIEPVTP